VGTIKSSSSSVDRRSRDRDFAYNKKMQGANCSNEVKIKGWLTKLENWADELLEKANEW